VYFSMSEFGAFKPVSVSKQFVKLSICCIKPVLNRFETITGLFICFQQNWNWFPKLTKLPRGAVLAVCFPDKMVEGNALDENENIKFFSCNIYFNYSMYFSFSLIFFNVFVKMNNFIHCGICLLSHTLSILFHSTKKLTKICRYSYLDIC